MPFSIHRKPDDRDADARLLEVSTVFYADLPDWWCRLTAPFTLSWRRQAALLAALPMAGFAFGLLAGLRLAG